jgi:lambda family phage minor tail protein L
MNQELGQLSHDAIIELFEVDLTPVGQPTVLRFCSEETAGGGSIILDGVTYEPWPIKAEGFEAVSKGSLPEPIISISNYLNSITALILAYTPQGAKVRRRRIFAKHLDTGVNPNPAAQFVPDEFILDSWTENALVVQFRLVTELEYLNLQIPKRRIVALRQSV